MGWHRYRSWARRSVFRPQKQLWFHTLSITAESCAMDIVITDQLLMQDPAYATLSNHPAAVLTRCMLQLRNSFSATRAVAPRTRTVPGATRRPLRCVAGPPRALASRRWRTRCTSTCRRRSCSRARLARPPRGCAPAPWSRRSASTGRKCGRPSGICAPLGCYNIYKGGLVFLFL